MNLEDLGRRAVASKWWRWMPGMAVLGGFAGVDRLFTDKFGMIHVPDKDAGMVPDLSDPATLGCLLHLVREAWNACRISLCFSAYTPDASKRWAVPISFVTQEGEMKHVPSFYGWTHAEALVSALEAAP